MEEFFDTKKQLHTTHIDTEPHTKQEYDQI